MPVTPVTAVRFLILPISFMWVTSVRRGSKFSTIILLHSLSVRISQNLDLNMSYSLHDWSFEPAADKLPPKIKDPPEIEDLHILEGPIKIHDVLVVLEDLDRHYDSKINFFDFFSMMKNQVFCCLQVFFLVGVWFRWIEISKDEKKCSL